MSVVDGPPVTVKVSQLFPAAIEEAWTLVTQADLVAVSKPLWPIPGVVEIRDEQAGFPDDGLARLLVNSDGSTAKEEIVRVDAPRHIRYTLSELTNMFRMFTSGADAEFVFESVDADTTMVTWSYTWHPGSVWVWFPLWLVVRTAYKRYMGGMIRRMSVGTPRRRP
jgi:uncharacterized protein YndB with AHSA1/START domain